MKITVLINGNDITHNTALPIKWNELLDERLDEARLSVRRTTTPLYPIGARVTITVDDVRRDFILAADESSEVPVGTGYYNHELSLIEPTKILEGIIVETLTFTNSLGRNYTQDPSSAPAYIYSLENNQWKNERYIETPSDATSTLPQIGAILSPHDSNEPLTINSINAQMTVASGGSLVEYNPYCPELTLVSPEGIEYQKKDNFESITIEKPSKGEWTAYYNVAYKPDALTLNVFRIKYVIQVVDNQNPLPKWNIRTVLERVLDLAEPHREGKMPSRQFYIDPAQLDMLGAIEAPEFAFTQMTLKEILDQIGGYIHGIPRLIAADTFARPLNTIHFDMLGGTEYAKLAYTAGNRLNKVKSECNKSFEGHDEFQNTIINMTFNDETLAQYNEEQQKAFEEKLKAQQHKVMPIFLDENGQPCEPKDE